MPAACDPWLARSAACAAEPPLRVGSGLRRPFLPPLTEGFSVKDIGKIINPTDLPHKDYEPLLRQVEYQGTSRNICKWLVHNTYNGWEVYIEFANWFEQLKDTRYNAKQVADLLMWSGDIRLMCKCPSFTFWGYQYILTQLDCSIVPETRFPHVRNPHLAGIACKHLRKLFRVLPFQTGRMATAIKRQRDEAGLRYTPG